MPKATTKKTTSARKDPLGSSNGNATRAKKPAKAAPAQKQTMAAKPARTSDNQKDWNYLLLVAMTATDPQVSRLLSVPPTMSFDKFHGVLQIAFGWAESHMHTFSIEKLGAGGWSPTIMSLSRFPMTEDEDMNDKPEAEWTLADVYENLEWKDKVQISYEYDMGDGWEHSISLLGRQQPASWAGMGIPADMKAMCLTGHGHPVAEDSGGFGGWEHLKELFAKPRMKDEDDRKDWYKNGGCANGDPKGLNPHEWDTIQVNTDLSDIPL